MLSESPSFDDPSEKVELYKPSLRQLVNLLQSFRSLTIPEIEEMAGLKHRRLDSLLNNENLIRIRTQEIITLFKLYEDLESGRISLKVKLNQIRRRKNKA